MNYDTGWEQNTTLKVGINGFGRIGRLVCRHILSISNCKVVSINALSKPEFLAYKFKYDTVHGTFKGDLSWDESNLYIDGNKIKVTNQRNPIDIHWEQSGAEYVCESTGFFTTTESAHQHILGGAKYVVITAPPKDNTPMFVMGVNHQKYIGQEVISNASCTTNCLAPIAKVLHDHFGIKDALMSTIHSMTSNQLTVDGSPRGGKDWRAGRSASQNIIPTSTGAAKAVSKIIPELEGKITGMSFRVPTVNVSVVDLTCSLERGTDINEIFNIIDNESNSSLHGILKLTDQPLVSSDFIGESCSSVVDKNACIELNERFVKIVAWYDNEWGYSKRVVELIQHMANYNENL